MHNPLLSQDNKLIAIIVEPRYRPVRHLLLILLLVVSYNSMMVTFMGNLAALGSGILYLSLIQFAVYLGVVYINIYLLMPRLFFKKRYIAYCLALLGIVSLVFFNSYVIEYFVSRKYSLEPGLLSYINSKHYIAIDYVSDVSVTGMCCAGTSLTLLFRNWLTDGKLREEMETRQLRAEIGKFKTSVNPVFLSGVLAVAAENAAEDRELSAGMLSRLSRFLRYRLYDSGRGIVMLNSETAFLDNYLSLLQKVRGDLSYSISDNAARAAIPPSLLINITDIILAGAGETTPVKFEMELSRTGEGCVALNISSGFTGAGTVSAHMSDMIRKVLDHAVPENYSFTVSPGRECYAVAVEFKTVPA